MDIQDYAYNQHLAALASLPNYKLAADPKSWPLFSWLTKWFKSTITFVLFMSAMTNPLIPSLRTHLSMVLIFLYGLDLSICHMPPDALYLTSAGAPFDSNDLKSGRLCTISFANPNPFCCRLFVHIYLMVCFIPGSDLLQRYWIYTTTRVHRDRHTCVPGQPIHHSYSHCRRFSCRDATIPFARDSQEYTLVQNTFWSQPGF